MTEASPVKGASTTYVDASFTELPARRRGRVRRYFLQHPRMMDLAVAMSYLLLVTPTVVEAANDGDWAAIALMAALSMVLLFRRDHPVTVVAVVAVLEVAITMIHPWGSNVSAGLWFALYALAVSSTRRFSLTALALATAPLAMVYFLMLVGPLERSLPADRGGPPDSQQVFSIVAGITITLSNIIATGIGISVRQRREHEQEIAAWASRAAMLGSVTERNRIAREMHDVVAHSLTVMVTLSDGAAVVIKKSPIRAAEVLDELSRTGRTALADMRRVLGVLRNDDVAGETQAPREPLAAGASLGKLLEGFRTAGLPLHYTHTGPALPVDVAFQLTVYRIVQESLTNVLRYGRSLSRVDLNIVRDGSRVSIEVSDDGRGMAAPQHGLAQLGPGPGSAHHVGGQAGFGQPGSGQSWSGQPGSGQGIQGMRERAGIYAGTVEAGPAAGGGWRVRAVLEMNGDNMNGTS